MPNKKIFICILLLFSGSLFSQNISKLDLTKSFWFYKKPEKNNLWDKATVPGTIHTDLLNAGIIEDPFFRDNEKKLQWIENQNFDYRTFFQVDQNLLSKNHIDLIFEGIDTYASVYVNGKILFQADNMFRTWKINCKEFLILGRNEIVVKFLSSAKIAKQKYDSLKVKLPNDERVMVRKAQYQFGWDWGPRFVSCGIWKNVFIEAWDELKIENVQINTSYIGKQKAFLFAVCNICLLYTSPSPRDRQKSRMPSSA